MPDAAFVDHCLELLAPLGRARAGRLFGGHGIWVDELCVALIIRETLYLKTDDAHRAAFEAAGCQAFTYATGHGEVHVTSYFTAPEEAMESAALMQDWGRRALAAAVASRSRSRAPARAARRGKARP